MTSPAPVQISGYIPGTWTIDPVHSYVGFVVRHLMVSKFHGSFASFSGQITTGEDPLDSQVAATVDVGSIVTGDRARDDRIRSADFFDAANFPTMSFASSGVRDAGGKYLVDGDLTIRGVTRAVSLTVELPQFGVNPQGDVTAGFSAAGVIQRSDFGVSFTVALPGGGVTLSDKVTIVLDIEANLGA
jgi:polyisoprenoid-binding protein YceI